VDKDTQRSTKKDKLTLISKANMVCRVNWDRSIESVLTWEVNNPNFGDPGNDLQSCNIHLLVTDGKHRWSSVRINERYNLRSKLYLLQCRYLC